MIYDKLVRPALLAGLAVATSGAIIAIAAAPARGRSAVEPDRRAPGEGAAQKRRTPPALRVAHPDPATPDASPGGSPQSYVNADSDVWSLLKRVVNRIGNDNMTLIAAGIAFYAMLALFPALGAFLSIYGLFVSPTEAARQAGSLAAMLPPEAAKLVADGLTKLSETSATSLNVAAFTGFALALWSARTAMAAMMTGMNIVNDTDETRSFVMQQVVALALTLGAIVVVIFGLGVIAILPVVLRFLHFGDITETLVSWGRWPILALLLTMAVSLIYRYAPARPLPSWKLITRGAFLATLLWIVGSAGFSFYVSRFGSYDATYGSLGAVIILLFWFWLSAVFVLAGAEFEAERAATQGPNG